ncbi:peptidoglycan-binding protein [Patescibacteria group bacterium]|nr:peptidoglycan-binding protein [Patescibacteria group bacterium]
MKNTKRLSLSLLIIFCSYLFPSQTSGADSLLDYFGELSYPAYKSFIVSAYYSPLPCQSRYVTGSYDGDIRLNGRGTNGADGTEVYPGMIAAPKSFPFGTKLYIPGIGITAVHDRGGAIVHAGERSNAYDRLDVWMGYGDIGLTRALNWGKRTVSATVYGKTDAVEESIELPGYSPNEAIPNECNLGSNPAVESQVDELEVMASEFDVDLDENFSFTLSLGAEGERVRTLQEELRNFNYYKGEITGVYDETTVHAVFKFQQARGIIEDEADFGAGVFGPKTSSEMNFLISLRNETRVLVAAATSVYMEQKTMLAETVDDDDVLLAAELGFGDESEEVVKLQNFLKDMGYFDHPYYTQYYGEVTQAAVLSFQLDNEIVSTGADVGAGRVGPSTLDLINSFS